MAQGYDREWKFRAWDPVNKKMYTPEDLEEPDTAKYMPKTIYGKLINGELLIQNISEEPPITFLPMQSTNWYDNEQYEIYEGDILEMGPNKERFCQVIWDEECSGYLLLFDDGSIEQGGDYMSDIMHIAGNVFEDGDADPEERKRLLRFRAWDPEARIMYMPEDLKDPEEDFTVSLYGYLSFGALYIYDFKNDPPMELIPQQSTGWKDSKGVEIFEGDVMQIGEYTVQLVWTEEVGQFILESTDGTIIPGSGMAVSQGEVIGDIFRNPELVPSY